MMTAQDFHGTGLGIGKGSLREQGEVPVGAVVGQGRADHRYQREITGKNENTLCHAEIEAIHNACQAFGRLGNVNYM